MKMVGRAGDEAVAWPATSSKPRLKQLSGQISVRTRPGGKVIEVSYDRFNGGRFRHGTSLLRWRPDKAPAQCTMDQLKQKRANLESILS